MSLLTLRYQEQVYASLDAYLFGHEASAVAAREAPRWRAWMDNHFPTAETASETAASTS